MVNPLVRLAFRLRIPDHGEAGAGTAANLAYGVSDVSMTPSARRWGDRRIVINTPALALLAEQYAPLERHGDPDVSPREFLNLRDRISAGAEARRAMAVFVDRMLRG